MATWGLPGGHVWGVLLSHGNLWPLLLQGQWQAGMRGMGMDVGSGGALEWGQLARAGSGCPASPEGQPPHGHVGA